MPYMEIDFIVDPTEPWRDLLMVELMDLGYEGFEETPHGLKAYIPVEHYRSPDLERLPILHNPHVSLHRSARQLPEENWNARWESGFQPMDVEGRVRIRAEFHPSVPDVEHELVITPRMAFGTGHHATTRMMVRSMLQFPVEGQYVCDLGCGTGVLGILAERLGAQAVLAIDNDPVAVENARYNARVNHCERLVVEKGDARLENRAGFGTILANIERNTLIAAMPYLAKALRKDGHLLLSGFLTDDAHLLDAAAMRQGLANVQVMADGEWAFSRWVKNESPDQ
ncbi:MAG TPA: 50S ribosomal protein L11 methyltransferase [Flavobacteriales bacterium]|nr:50S ribosomal protein L11 methyltransferase [Flavobacteriales bacterium]HRP80601.1 50S ribosomal protein L11 methyltransferase [Flavobacteriales bacterium]